MNHAVFSVTPSVRCNWYAADSLLAARHQERGLKPNVQRYVTGLENRSNADCELFSASVALFQTGSHATFLVLNTSERTSLANRTAVRTHNPIWPNNALELCESGGFIVEVGTVENAVWHGRTFLGTATI
jgi:hypothetical protein